MGKISVGIIWREARAAKREEWIGTRRIEFTRKPAWGDHVGSGLHSYRSRLCSLPMTFIAHARLSVHGPRNLGNLLFLLKLCFIEILFGVSLSVTRFLSCLTAKIVKLSTARPFEFALLMSLPVVVSKLANLPSPAQRFLGFYKLRASYHLFLASTSRWFGQGF